LPTYNSQHISSYNGMKRELRVKVVTEPDKRIEYINYTVQSNELNGKILVRGKLYPEYKYGDVLVIKCNFKKVNNFDEKFKYDKYLQRFGIYSLCYYPSIQYVSNDANFVIDLILKIKGKFADRIDLLYPEPQSSFLAGLLYGSRSGLPAELTENFNRTGVTHIIAISGYNISIIVVFVLSLLIRVGLFRQQAFFVTVFLIIIFVIFTGASASVVRAGIMGLIVLLAQYLSRPVQTERVLTLTLLMMLLINPYILFYDSGFQLSFLATIGLIYFSPILIRFSQHILKTKIKRGILVESLITTMSAIIFTLPLIIFQFERLSIVALFVNILILWLIPYIMLLGFISILVSYIFLLAGELISYIVYLLLNYVILLTTYFGDKTWSSIEFNISLLTVVLSYIVLISFVIYVKTKNTNI